MPNQPTDKNQKAVLEKTGRRMSNPSDEKPQRTAGTEEEQLSGKIEKVTESLLSQWEISEDDFEDTQDLTETAARISRQIAPGASNGNAAGSIRREEAGPLSHTVPRSQAAARGEAAAPRGDAGEKRSGKEGGYRTEGSNRPESRRPATERTGERKVSSNRPGIETRRQEAGKTADKRNTSAERSRQKPQTDTRESRRQDPAEKRQPVKHDSGKDSAARPPRSERYESRQGSQTPRMADPERPNRTSSAAMATRNGAERSANSKAAAAGPEKSKRASEYRGTEREEYIRRSKSDRNAGKRRPRENDDWDEEADVRPANAKNRTQPPSGKSRDYAENIFSRNPGRKSASHKKQENPVVEFWNSLHTMDKVVGFMGIFVCIFAVVTFSALANAKSVDEQVDAFASVGQNLSQLNIAGESTFMAVADAHKAKQEAADFSESMEESEEYNEKDDNSDVQVGLNMTSVEKDLKIKFVNRKTGKLIPHVDFQLEIK